MRKLFFTIPVVLALLVSAVFTVQRAIAAGPINAGTLTCGAGDQYAPAAAVVNTGTSLAVNFGVTINLGLITGLGVFNAPASSTWTWTGAYTGSYSCPGGPYTIILNPATTTTTTTTTTAVDAPPPPPPFWANDPKGAQRIDADPGEQMAIYCYPGGYVDIWDTSGTKTKEFATTTYFALAKIAPGTTGTLGNDLTGGTFTATMDITGKFVTAISSDGKYSKTFSLDKCLTWVNYKVDPQVNYPQTPSYTVNTSAVITNQLNAAKARLASAVGAAAIAQAQADVARWESLYRSNNTVITENANGTITFQFSDGTIITV